MKSTDTVTLTLKNISPHLHRQLKAQAKQHKRSLNQEAILCLEHAVVMEAGRPSLAAPPPPVSVGAILHPWSSRAGLLEGFLDRADETPKIASGGGKRAGKSPGHQKIQPGPP